MNETASFWHSHSGLAQGAVFILERLRRAHSTSQGDTTMIKPLNVLFLCTHNAARSIMAEAVLNHLGGHRFRAYSAGTQARADHRPHPLTLEVLRAASVSTDGLRSKSWTEFSAADAPAMDLVVTVCDMAAGESCPVWPGHPRHSALELPGSVQGGRRCGAATRGLPPDPARTAPAA